MKIHASCSQVTKVDFFPGHSARVLEVSPRPCALTPELGYRSMEALPRASPNASPLAQHRAVRSPPVPVRSPMQPAMCRHPSPLGTSLPGPCLAPGASSGHRSVGPMMVRMAEVPGMGSPQPSHRQLPTRPGPEQARPLQQVLREGPQMPGMPLVTANPSPFQTFRAVPHAAHAQNLQMTPRLVGPGEPYRVYGTPVAFTPRQVPVLQFQAGPPHHPQPIVPGAPGVPIPGATTLAPGPMEPTVGCSQSTPMMTHRCLQSERGEASPAMPSPTAASPQASPQASPREVPPPPPPRTGNLPEPAWL